MTEQLDPWPVVPILRSEGLEQLPEPDRTPDGWADARAERRRRYLAGCRRAERVS